MSNRGRESFARIFNSTVRDQVEFYTIVIFHGAVTRSKISFANFKVDSRNLFGADVRMLPI
jgi:hypothetical protein